jgi:hypothetical protein
MRKRKRISAQSVQQSRHRPRGSPARLASASALHVRKAPVRREIVMALATRWGRKSLPRCSRPASVESPWTSSACSTTVRLLDERAPPTNGAGRTLPMSTGLLLLRSFVLLGPALTFMTFTIREYGRKNRTRAIPRALRTSALRT